MQYRILEENPYSERPRDFLTGAPDLHLACVEAEELTGVDYDFIRADLESEQTWHWIDEETGREVTVWKK